MKRFLKHLGAPGLVLMPLLFFCVACTRNNAVALPSGPHPAPPTLTPSESSSVTAMAEAFSRAVVDGRRREWRAFLSPAVHISCVHGYSDPAHPICKQPPLHSFRVMGAVGGFAKTASVAVRFIGVDYKQNAVLRCAMRAGHWRITWVSILPGD